MPEREKDREEAVRRVLDTLNAIDVSALRLRDRKQGWLWELGRLISAKDGFTSDFFVSDAFRQTCDSFFGSRKESFSALLSLDEKVELSRILARCAGHGEKEIPSFLRLSFPENRRVSYLKSAAADTAFRRFSHVVPDPAAEYESSFSAVCESVYDGTSSFCILPVANSGEGTLGGFRKLIEKYELKIACACLVPSPDETETEFALCQKTFGAYPISGGTQMRFRFSLPATGSSDLADVLYALDRLNAPVGKIDSVPLPYAERDFTYDVTAGADRADLSAISVFLSLCAPRFTPIGLYSVIK